MGRRIYKSNFNAVSVGTAVQDLWLLKSGASNGIQLHRCDMSAASITTATQINVRLKRGTATVTVGSGGTTPTAFLADDGDSEGIRLNHSRQRHYSGHDQRQLHYFVGSGVAVESSPAVRLYGRPGR